MVSIILPVYNREKTILSALESVVCQSYKKWELIVVDDGSVDGTANVIASVHDDRIHYIKSAVNRGASHARNTGLNNAKGSKICYLDSDNTMHEDYLLIMTHKMNESEGCKLAYCAQRRFKCGEEISEIYILFSEFQRARLENHNYIDCGVLMHDRSLLDKIGFFNEEMRRLVDWEYFLRLTEDHTPLTVPCILSNYYFHKSDNQISNNEDIRISTSHIDTYLRSKPASRYIRSPLVEKMYFPHSKTKTGIRRKVSIVIPNYRIVEYLDICLSSIREFSKNHDFEIVIVDNNSGIHTRSYLGAIKDSFVKTCLNTRNYGFTHAVNQGIGLAEKERDIIILNNDTFVCDGWLEGMQKVFEYFPDVGLIVPQQAVLPGEKTIVNHQPWQDRGRETDINLSYHHRNVLRPLHYKYGGCVELKYAPFFCVYIPRATFDAVGLLDEENGPHYRSDWLYCDAVRTLAKRKIIYAPHSKVYHFVQKATNEMKSTDARMYKCMFVDNSWTDILKQQECRRSC